MDEVKIKEENKSANSLHGVLKGAPKRDPLNRCRNPAGTSARAKSRAAGPLAADGLIHAGGDVKFLYFFPISTRRENFIRRRL